MGNRATVPGQLVYPALTILLKDSEFKSAVDSDPDPASNSGEITRTVSVSVLIEPQAQAEDSTYIHTYRQYARSVHVM